MENSCLKKARARLVTVCSSVRERITIKAVTTAVKREMMSRRKRESSTLLWSQDSNLKLRMKITEIGSEYFLYKLNSTSIFVPRFSKH
jgi:hypothetical protein